MITIHPTYKQTSEGFVPMINLRGEKGRMLGSRTPQGGAREYRTFTTPAMAAAEALAIAMRIADRFSCIKVA